jgi:choline dehydrogenase-like flavoprotein
MRVHGIGGLRVADAGIMPTITSGNTNAPTLAIAEKAARWIAEDVRSSANGRYGRLLSHGVAQSLRQRNIVEAVEEMLPRMQHGP